MDVTLFRCRRRGRRPGRPRRRHRSRPRRAESSLSRQACAGRRADQPHARCTTTRRAADGPQIASQLTDDATAAGVEIGFGEVVRLSGNGPWTIETAEGERHTGRAVVIATGLAKGRLGLPEEDEYEGRGLSHCASCDGPLYAGQPVIVAGAGGWAPHEAEELEGIRQRSHRHRHGGGRSCPTACATWTDASWRWKAATGCSPSWSRAAARGRPFRPARCSSMSASLPLRNSCRICLHATPPGISWSTKRAATSAATAFAAGDVRAGARHYLADAIADGQRAAQAVVAALAKTT